MNYGSATVPVRPIFAPSFGTDTERLYIPWGGSDRPLPEYQLQQHRRQNWRAFFCGAQSGGRASPWERRTGALPSQVHATVADLMAPSELFEADVGKLYQGGNWHDLGALKKQVRNLITVKRNQLLRTAVRTVEERKKAVR